MPNPAFFLPVNSGDTTADEEAKAPAQFLLSYKIKHWSYQGWALRSFPFGTLCSFPFLKKNVQFFSFLFSSFWRLMRPKRTQRMQHSFAKNGKERKEGNILLQRTEKNARMFRSFKIGLISMERKLEINEKTWRIRARTVYSKCGNRCGKCASGLGDFWVTY